MEFFLALNLIGAVIGFIVAMTSRSRYVKKCARLEKELFNLRNLVNGNAQSINQAAPGVNMANVLNQPAQQSYPAQPMQQAIPQAQQMPVQDQQTPVRGAPVQSEPVQPVAMPAPVQQAQPVQPMQQVQPVAQPAPVQSAPQVQPQRTVQPAPVAKPAKSKKISAVALSFAVGVLLLIIAAAVFITATWNSMPSAVKPALLFGVVGITWVFSFITTKKLKIEKTGSALYILGSGLMPLAILGTVLALGYELGLITLALCSASLMITGFIGYKIFKTNFQIGISVTGLAWLVIFLTMKIISGLLGFVLGFALVFAIFCVVYEISKIPSFKIASEIVAYASPIVYILAAVAMFDADEVSRFILAIVSIVIIVASMFLFSKRRAFAKYVASIFAGVTVPLVSAESIAFAGENAVGAYIAVVFAYIFVAALYVVMKLAKNPAWLACGLTTLSAALTSSSMFLCSDVDSNILITLILGISLFAAAGSYIVREMKIEKMIYAVLSSIMFLVVLNRCFNGYTIANIYTVAGIVVAVGVLSLFTKKIPFLYEALGLCSVVQTLYVAANDLTYIKLIPTVIIFISAYILRKTKIEKAIFALATAVTSCVTLSLILEGKEIAFIYVMLGVVALALVANIITKRIPFLFEAFALSSAVGVWGTVVIDGEAINKNIFFVMLFVAITVWLFKSFKKSSVRDVFQAVSVSAAIIAGAVLLNNILYWVAELNGDVTSLILFLFFAVFYVAAAVFTRIKKDKILGMEVFRYISVAMMSVMEIIYIASAFGDSFAIPQVVTVLIVGLIACVTIVELRNYFSIVPTFIFIYSIMKVVDGLSIVPSFFVALLVVFLFSLVGRFVNRRIISSKGIDWLTLTAPFALGIITSDENLPFYVMMALAFYAITFLGRFAKDDKSFGEAVKGDIKLVGSVAIMFAGIGLAVMNFFDFPDAWEIEIRMLFILAAAAIVAFLIKPSGARWVWFATVAFFVHVEAFNALITGANEQLILVGALGLVLFIVAFLLKNKTWLILALETIAGIGIYLAISYWNSQIWWIYLLVAGLLLISTATVTEVKRRKHVDGAEKTPRFKEWKW